MFHTHTFEGVQSWVTKPTNAEYTPLLEKTRKFIFVQSPSTGQLSQQSQHHTFNGTALQQKLPTIFGLHFTQPMLLAIDFELAHRLLSPSFIHLCTNLHTQHLASLMNATKWTGWVGWIAQACEGPTLGSEWHTHWLCYPVCQHPIPEINTRHHANRALSRIHDTSGPLCSTIIS